MLAGVVNLLKVQYDSYTWISRIQSADEYKVTYREKHNKDCLIDWVWINVSTNTV